MLPYTYYLSWNDLTTRVMTNLYLYGSLPTPEDYNDRIRPTKEEAPQIVFDMAAFMRDGPGRYAYEAICNAPFV
jgi:hypothetical protein